MTQAQTDPDVAFIVDEIAQTIARHMQIQTPTTKIRELADKVLNTLRVVSAPKPGDVVALFVGEKLVTRQEEAQLWLQRQLLAIQAVKAAFPSCERVVVLPVEMDLQRVSAQALPTLRDKIAGLLVHLDERIVHNALAGSETALEDPAPPSAEPASAPLPDSP